MGLRGWVPAPLRRVARTVLDRVARRLERTKESRAARIRARLEVARWDAAGRPAPPPHVVKQRVLRQYARDHGLRVLVETGTYLGDMVHAMKPHFDRVYSIELSDELHEQARRRFAGDDHVTLLRGDSGVVIRQIVAQLRQPALFWLDGHYSGGNTASGARGTPVLEELGHILDAPDLGHVVVIDDARLFGTDPAYPTILALEAFVLARRRCIVTVADDSIRVVPAR